MRSSPRTIPTRRRSGCEGWKGGSVPALFGWGLFNTRIFTIRGVQVMLDRDLAELYGVPTKALNQAVKRNRERFPERFMFQLNRVELDALTSRVLIQDPNGSSSDLRSQFVTSSLQTPYYQVGT